MGSGVSRFKNGSVTGTGADLSVTSIGFKPSYVKVFNVASGGLCYGEHSSTMADGSMFKQITAGTVTFVTTNGITLTANGFDLGADTDVNVDGELVHYIAIE